MSFDKELHNWVSDKLHEAMGMSDRTSVDFLISLGKKSDSVDKYVTMLDPVLGELGNLKEVATEIWNKIPRKLKAENVNRVKERIAIAEREENKSYQMLSDSDGGEEEDIVPVIKPQRERDKRKSSKKKKNKSNSDDDSDDDKNKRSSKKKKKSRKKNDSSSASDEDEELKREKDLRERDEFAERLKKRDKEHTRNLAEKSDKKAHEEARKRLQMEEKDKRALVPELRDRARKEYVKKRKMEKVDMLREDIEEEEKMFDESTLSAREKLERQYKKKVSTRNIFFWF